MRTWIAHTWENRVFAEAVSHASPVLARRIREILNGGRSLVEVRSATRSLVRYALRTGRPTPFGAFAGHAPASFGPATRVRWGPGHRIEVRPDASWLEDLVHQLEDDPEQLDRLPVVASNLALVRGDRVYLTHRDTTVKVDHTTPVREALARAAAPVRFGDLTGHLALAFGADTAVVRSMLVELVRLEVLITALRAPGTVPVTEQIDHILSHTVRTPGSVDLLTALARVREDLKECNRAVAPDLEALERRMRTLSAAGRTPFGLHLHLDNEVRLPTQVARDMATAADALLRLAPYARFPVWEQYQAAFLDRYGIGTRVPLLDLVHPDHGLGYPATYPGSPMPKLPERPATDRDMLLLELVQEAAVTGCEEILLNDALLERLGAGLIPRVPPHIEMKATVLAPTVEAVDRGVYRLYVTPAYHGGVFTARFSSPGTPQREVLERLPTGVAGALPVQVVSTPAHTHGQNVARVGRFTEHTIVIGEHPGGDGTVIPVEELAVTADWGRLYLLWKDRVVEPVAFHALALEKQPPTLARFLINLARGGHTPILEMDWGPAQRLPFLPALRRGRAILTPARWRLTSADLPGRRVPLERWAKELHAWAGRWRMPHRIALHHGDQVLVVDLSVPAHQQVLRTHLDGNDAALLYRHPSPEDLGWCDGRAHEVATTLVSAGPQRCAPPFGVEVTADREQFPAGAGTRWVSAKVFGARDRQNEILTHHLPHLQEELGRKGWFIRYWDSHDRDHLRIRIPVTGSEDYGTCTTALGRWADALRGRDLCRHLVLDTYRPETGRYGAAGSLAAAERLFVSDSGLITAQLRALSGLDPIAVGAAGAFLIASAFLGSTALARNWFIDHPVQGPFAETARTTARDALALATGTIRDAAWHRLGVLRTLLAQDVTAYRTALPKVLDADTVLESLVHMHHNRWFGPDRATERTALRTTRALALALRDRRAAA